MCLFKQRRRTKNERRKDEGRKQEEGAKELNHSFAPSYFKDLILVLCQLIEFRHHTAIVAFCACLALHTIQIA